MVVSGVLYQDLALDTPLRLRCSIKSACVQRTELLRAEAQAWHQAKNSAGWIGASKSMVKTDRTGMSSMSRTRANIMLFCHKRSKELAMSPSATRVYPFCRLVLA